MSPAKSITALPLPLARLVQRGRTHTEAAILDAMRRQVALEPNGSLARAIRREKRKPK